MCGIVFAGESTTADSELCHWSSFTGLLFLIFMGEKFFAEGKTVSDGKCLIKCTQVQKVVHEKK